ncbi:MAG: hypothetical protein SFU56_07425 [Capsulimonadales bacterium]|nr:hypothetical protein [Capsulimonadales bacterium]
MRRLSRTLRYTPASVLNPLKGLVPYQGDHRTRFPHSLEFNYLPLSGILVGPDTYDWTPLENLLSDISGRGHQAVFRIFLEYPGKRNVIPKYLIDRGLKVFRYVNTNTQPLPPTEVETPDYRDPRLTAALTAFIAALGKRYDGDPRLGFVTAGLIGTWGEWHTFPRSELFAPKAVQEAVLDAYESAFRTTPVLLRYPAGPKDEVYSPNHRRRFGYHDDSFAWATLETGKRDDRWFFLSLLKTAGPEAQAKWKRFPIGGEIRPEAWGKVFDTPPGDRRIQDFRTCVTRTRVTWLMDTGMFEKPPSPERRRRAETEVRRMGYEFHIPGVTIEREGDSLMVRTEVTNRGVAPFYYDWSSEYAIATPQGAFLRTFPGNGRITGLLPGDSPRLWEDRLTLTGLPSGHYRLLLRLRSPLKNGVPLRFANAEQDTCASGWLTLANLER